MTIIKITASFKKKKKKQLEEFKVYVRIESHLIVFKNNVGLNYMNQLEPFEVYNILQ